MGSPITTAAGQTIAPGWRPPQWTTNAAPLTIIGPDLSGAPGAPPTLYVFDNAGRADHNQELVITENPVQTGAAISDHAYLRPSRVTVEVWMSDCMQSYISGQFSGAPSRSVSAFQTLLGLQSSLQLLQVATRLKLYNNMLIASISDSDTVDQRYGLRCSVTFQEVILANQTELTSATVSFSPDTSDQTSRAQTIASTQSGQSQPVAVPATTTTQHSIANAPAGTDLQAGSTVPNSGIYSSTNVNTLSQVLQ